MPCFFLHWAIAIKSIEDGLVPSFIKEGYDKYVKITKDYSEKLDSFKKFVIDNPEYKTWAGSFASDKKPIPRDLDTLAFTGDETIASMVGMIKSRIDTLVNKYENNIRQDTQYDEITYFSSYLLGACGPDFWMLLVDSGGMEPYRAPIHFDLGHYNRTHGQFRSFLKYILTKPDCRSGKDLTRFGKLVTAYFYGMATHYAADLNVHQLVNVSAGAYSLLESLWNPEHGAMGHVPWVMRLFNAHNKVEHFWDTYVRYRWFGNYGRLWEDMEAEYGAWLTALTFPVCEKLSQDIDNAPNQKNFFGWKNDFSRIFNDLLTASGQFNYEYILKIEACHNIPRIVCDRIIRGEFKCFLYEIYVDKRVGAYPEKLVFPEAMTEANHPQFGCTELNKLRFFASEPNSKAFLPEFKYFCTNNYLVYWAMPRLKRLQEYGRKVFYDLNDLPAFVESSRRTANAFVHDLSAALGTVLDGKPSAADIEKMSLGTLGKFWNLDTGLGLEINSMPSDTPKEVITKIKFGHVVDLVNRTRIPCYHGTQYLKDKLPAKYSDDPNSNAVPMQKIYSGAEFENISTVTENDTNTFMDRIRLKEKQATKSIGGKIDMFFKNGEPKDLDVLTVPTENVCDGKEVVVRYVPALTRLNILFEAAIADLDQGNEEVCFYTFNDNRPKVADTVRFQEAEHLPHRWLQGKLPKGTKVKPLEFITVKSGEKTVVREGIEISKKNGYRLCEFRTHLLLNLEDNKITFCSANWENVIDLDKLKEPIGRNFAIATGRKGVLHPSGSGRFKPDMDFLYYSNLSPTEHVFFTLSILVKDCRKEKWKVYDLISKEEVNESDLKNIIKIDCVNYVKIVLFYKLFQSGGVQLDECYIDGEVVPVNRSGEG